MRSLRRLRHGQQGQAMVLGMLLAGAVLIVLVRYFAVGQVAAAKARQTHALDAAAYSGALVQARALNMLSYINRAHIGHQVAMAHLVTLGSWASLGGMQAKQLASGNPPAHLIAMLFGPEHGAAYTAASRATGIDRLAESHASLASAYAAHDRVTRETLVAVQNAVVGGLQAARYAAMQSVLRSNYPESDSSKPFDLAIDRDGWPGFLKSYSGHGALRGMVEDVVPLYGFLSPRNQTSSNAWAVDPRCPQLRHELRRRGETQLDGQGRWQSLDTLSFHALRSNRWIGCYYREYAMGWGWIPSARTQSMGQAHVEDPPENFSAQDFWRWVKEATDWDIAAGNANPLANSKASAARQRWEGGGLPAYYDTSDNRLATPLRFEASLRREGPEALTLTTRTAADTYFARPQPRAGGEFEAPNLFHPYWQARLAAPVAVSSHGASP